MQISLFDGSQRFKIEKPVRLIELFAGYGSQALALKYLGVTFEHHRIAEWTIKSTQAYKDLHFQNDNTDYSQEFSVDYLIDYLCEKGISQNYSEPMTKEQIKRLGEEKIRTAYNNIMATHNLVSVCTAKGKDLGIADTDKFTYVLTYSFPCQDLSSAGKCAGMEKGSGTRSGLLWEVERLLDECEELPQVLLMENVPEVIGSKNIKHFAKWVEFLDKLGYHSKWGLLNAKDFGIAQNRSRCFMVSILGDYYYDMPTGFKLEYVLKDFLDKKVDESYYLKDETIRSLTTDGSSPKHNNRVVEPIVYDDYNGRIRADQSTVGTLTTTCGNDAPRNGVKLIEQNYRVRKLTERECFKLMGVKQEDFEKLRKNQSKSSCYHLAGDSIVTTVLMAIFGQMFDINWKAKINEMVEEIIK